MTQNRQQHVPIPLPGRTSPYDGRQVSRESSGQANRLNVRSRQKCPHVGVREAVDVVDARLPWPALFYPTLLLLRSRKMMNGDDQGSAWNHDSTQFADCNPLLPRRQVLQGIGAEDGVERQGRKRQRADISLRDAFDHPFLLEQAQRRQRVVSRYDRPTFAAKGQGGQTRTTPHIENTLGMRVFNRLPCRHHAGVVHRVVCTRRVVVSRSIVPCLRMRGHLRSIRPRVARSAGSAISSNPSRLQPAMYQFS
jgi:hypothetical protein